MATKIHSQESPFPVTMPRGAVVHDEYCSCGHLRSDHYDTLAYGHGPCGYSDVGRFKRLAVDMNGEVPHCDCPKFTWAGMVRDDNR